ncbi:hypothetical protein [Microcystis phage Mwe-JY26]
MEERPTLLFNMADAVQAATEIKASVDAEVQRALQDATIGAIAQGFQAGYMRALQDYGLQPRPEGVTEVVEKREL